MIILTDKKKCSKCGKLKTIGEFSPAGTYKGGVRYRGDCKECRVKNKERYIFKKAGYRFCTICKQWKDESFYGDRKNVGTKDSWCKDCKNQYYKKWRGKNPEKSYGACKRWIGNNLERVKEIWRRKSLVRNSRKRTCGGSFTYQEWERLVLYYSPDGACLCCGAVRALTVDHVVPVFLGGSSDIYNIQPLCVSCNSKKHARHIDYRPDKGKYALDLMRSR